MTSAAGLSLKKTLPTSAATAALTSAFPLSSLALMAFLRAALSPGTLMYTHMWPAAGVKLPDVVYNMMRDDTPEGSGTTTRPSDAPASGDADGAPPRGSQDTPSLRCAAASGRRGGV